VQECGHGLEWEPDAAQRGRAEGQGAARSARVSPCQPSRPSAASGVLTGGRAEHSPSVLTNRCWRRLSPTEAAGSTAVAGSEGTFASCPNCNVCSSWRWHRGTVCGSGCRPIARFSALTSLSPWAPPAVRAEGLREQMTSASTACSSFGWVSPGWLCPTLRRCQPPPSSAAGRERLRGNWPFLIEAVLLPPVCRKGLHDLSCWFRHHSRGQRNPPAHLPAGTGLLVQGSTSPPLCHGWTETSPRQPWLGRRGLDSCGRRPITLSQKDCCLRDGAR